MNPRSTELEHPARARIRRFTLSVSTAAVRARRQRTVRRELLTGLVRKDLKIKYQGSVLGFAWSLANPLLTLIVYSLVFGLVFKNGVPDFGFYLMCGLLTWTLFATAVGNACGSVVGNSGLVKKVPFPLAVLPMSSVAFAVVHFVLQTIVLIAAMAVYGFADQWDAHLLLLVPSLLVVLMFSLGVSFLVAALNVRYRDTQHIVEVILNVGIWLNPIVYSLSLQLRVHLEAHNLWNVYFLNPVADSILAVQRALYGNRYTAADRVNNLPGKPVLPDPGYWFYLEKLAIGGAVAAVVLALTYPLYRRMSADFAEEL